MINSENVSKNWIAIGKVGCGKKINHNLLL